MVHSTFAQGHVLGGRDASPLGIPKSPSFHSGLDLVASASVDSLVSAQTSKHIENELNDFSNYITMTERAIQNNQNGQNAGNALFLRQDGCAVRALRDTGHLPLIEGDFMLIVYN